MGGRRCHGRWGILDARPPPRMLQGFRNFRHKHPGFLGSLHDTCRAGFRITQGYVLRYGALEDEGALGYVAQQLTEVSALDRGKRASVEGDVHDGPLLGLQDLAQHFHQSALPTAISPHHQIRLAPLELQRRVFGIYPQLIAVLVVGYVAVFSWVIPPKPPGRFSSAASSVSHYSRRVDVVVVVVYVAVYVVVFLGQAVTFVVKVAGADDDVEKSKESGALVMAVSSFSLEKISKSNMSTTLFCASMTPNARLHCFHSLEPALTT
eukprot:CAMPEP_0167800924 /NCGR_PEP_ID=MMETSP0111_2-20121227/18080_1 /TAXON_ID=91324 /ORGANISM="Lotharella globosa, Strain CCCM811" /LENGTH=264 /DNA_ID=CAMNT_0007696395 /DNA_START=120 /DNA_END=915 /DNA_ORIENTATION=+